jgi:hypothetical protein
MNHLNKLFWKLIGGAEEFHEQLALNWTSNQISVNKVPCKPKPIFHLTTEICEGSRKVC